MNDSNSHFHLLFFDRWKRAETSQHTTSLSNKTISRNSQESPFEHGNLIKYISTNEK
jgi:hypothetical protein